MSKTRGKKKLKVGFLMDPIEHINLETDTTMLLMLEAQTRGHQLLYFTPDELRVENGLPKAVLTHLQVRYPRVKGESHFTKGRTEDMELEELDLLFNRVDPPYDLAYVTMTQILTLIPPPTVVVNRPRGVLAANEKILALRFPRLMPPTIITREIPRLLHFLHEVGGKMVIKPLESFGGMSVFVVEEGHTNCKVLLETATEEGKRPVLAQKFLPVGKRGDKRIIMLGGEPIGAVLRLPAKGDHRANLHSGGTAKKTTLTRRDLEICRQVGPWLRGEGLYLAGLDIVAGFLTEINITSPTLVKQINEAEDTRLEKRIFDFCEYLVEAARKTTAG